MAFGYEIVYTGNLGVDLTGKSVIYLDADPNPITSEVWDSYVPPAGYILNSPRTNCFDVLEILGSPDLSVGQYAHVTTPDGYTWVSLSASAQSIYPYIPFIEDGITLSPQEVSYSISTPSEGFIIVESKEKNYKTIHWGSDQLHFDSSHVEYFILDPWDNKYILNSVNSNYDIPEKFSDAFNSAVLPSNWTKIMPTFLTEDLIYMPSYSGPNNSFAHSNEFRDSADSVWTQIEWGASGITLNAMTAGGLPIWAGALGGRLLGNDQNNLMYGGQGKDDIFAGIGDDAVYGGDSDDTIDGGLGSSFLSGGAGTDRFFIDARAATSASWSSVTDFSPGEQVTIWGYRPGLSKSLWVASDGAAGYKGATLHCDVDGNGLIDTSLTFTGLTQAQLPALSYGTVQGVDYVFIG